MGNNFVYDDNKFIKVGKTTPEQPRKDKAKIPQSDLEFNNKMVEPVWGKDEINSDLKDKLTKKYFQYNEETGELIIDPETGEPRLSREAIWGQLGILTRDIRGSNLSSGNPFMGQIDEINYCDEWIKLAGDLLSEGYEECALIALGRAAIRLELALSRNGFFRKRMGTYTQENVSENRDPPKHYFGIGKKNNY